MKLPPSDKIPHFCKQSTVDFRTHCILLPCPRNPAVPTGHELAGPCFSGVGGALRPASRPTLRLLARPGSFPLLPGICPLQVNVLCSLSHSSGRSVQAPQIHSPARRLPCVDDRGEAPSICAKGLHNPTSGAPLASWQSRGGRSIPLPAQSPTAKPSGTRVLQSSLSVPAPTADGPGILPSAA